MTALRENSYVRGRRERPRNRPFSIRLPVLFFVSIALIALSRLAHPAVKEIRAEAEALLAPLMGTLMVPFDPLRRFVRHVQASYESFAELERLRGENQRLRQWETRARDLESRVGELSNLVHALPDQSIEFRTLRVIASSSGAFLQSALLEGGSEHGIKVGHPVINADGLIGRIVEVGRRTSRVLLLTDINSRVPVTVGSSQARAMLSGDNGGEPRLMFVSAEAKIEDGDEVTTSGLGGLFPRGLRIGTIHKRTDATRVELAATLGSLQYASVLLYDNPGLALAVELGQKQPETPTRRRVTQERGGRP